MTTPGTAARERGEIALATGLALIALVVRIRGLGASPLAVDEYYFVEAIRNILAHGIPAFPDGGFYVRGIVVQYLSVVPVAVWSDTEAAARLVPALAGSATVGVLYLVARTVMSRTAAITVAVLLALSSWHIEFSRFARMYSMYQLVFLSFVFLLYQGYWKDRAAFRVCAWVIAFGSVLVHESSVLMVAVLGLVVLAYPDVRPRSWPRFWAALGGLAGLNIVIHRMNFRTLYAHGEPGGAVPDLGGAFPVRLPDAVLLREILDSAAGWAAWLALVAIVVAIGVGTIRSIRSPWARLCVALMGALVAAHQIGIAIAAWVVVAMMQPELRPGRDRRTLAVLGLVGIPLVFWAVAGRDAGITDWIASVVMVPGARDALVYPFTRAVPLWAVVVVLGTAVLTVRRLAARRVGFEDVCVAVVTLSVGFVSMLRTPYHSTRYSAFLLPILLLVLGMAASSLQEALPSRFSGVGRFVVGGALVILLVATEDYHVRHITGITTDAVMFRQGRFARFLDHWYPRADYRGPGQAVEAHRRDGDVVVVAATPSRAYVARPFATYVARNSPRYRSLARAGGTRDIWTGGVLISDPDALAGAVPRTGGTLWLVTPIKDLLEGTDLTASQLETMATRHTLNTERIATGRDGRIATYRIVTDPDPRSRDDRAFSE